LDDIDLDDLDINDLEDLKDLGIDVDDIQQEDLDELAQLVDEEDIAAFLEEMNENLIFATIADIDENNVFLKNSLVMIMTHFYNVYTDNLTSMDTAVFHSDELDTIIDSIISGNWEIDSYKDYYKEVEKLLNDLIRADEFLGAALLSVTGNSICSTLSEKLLSRTLKELDIRLQLGYLDLPLMIYVLKNGNKVVTKEIVNQEFLILLYSSTVPLGMCEITSNNVTSKIEKIFKNWS